MRRRTSLSLPRNLLTLIELDMSTNLARIKSNMSDVGTSHLAWLTVSVDEEGRTINHWQEMLTRGVV